MIEIISSSLIFIKVYKNTNIIADYFYYAQKNSRKNSKKFKNCKIYVYTSC